MYRALIVAALFSLLPQAVPSPPTSQLHITIVLVDADGKATPVPGHRLLISDNPASAPPRLITTARDGTADVKLRPGNYSIESDRPVAFNGKLYQWIQAIDIVAGRDASLALTVNNADVGAVGSTSGATGSPDTDPTFLLPRWQDSVVAVWTPTAHASAVVVDAKGLLATNQRVVGTATSVEVQLSATVKVAGTVLSSDAVRNVSVVSVDPALIASARPVPFGCGQPPASPFVATDGQEIFTISTPLRQPKGIAPGTVRRIEPQALVVDFLLSSGSSGGPVFAADGRAIGLTSEMDDKDEGRAGISRVILADAVCGVVAAAEKKMTAAHLASATHLPVEPATPFPVDALKDAAEKRSGSLNPYQISASTFDVALITPVLTYGAQYQDEQRRKRTASKDTRKPDVEPPLVRPLMDFSNWSEYVGDFPPVLLIRVTPKLVEGFWTTVGRVAARTQGVSLPPIKRFSSGFSRMRAYCGDAEVTPIHPFKLVQRLSENEAIYEGLYVFDPGAFGPHCGSVRLVLYSEKESEKGDERVVDAKIVQQVWQDFAPYRAAAPSGL
jgi:S1-C subfamily serine protease